MVRPKSDVVSKAYTFRLPAELMEAVREIATIERRPIGTQLVILIEQALAARATPTKRKEPVRG